MGDAVSVRATQRAVPAVLFFNFLQLWQQHSSCWRLISFRGRLWSRRLRRPDGLGHSAILFFHVTCDELLSALLPSLFFRVGLCVYYFLFSWIVLVEVLVFCRKPLVRFWERCGPFDREPRIISTDSR